MHSAFDFLICIPLTVYHWMLEDVTCLEVVMDKSYVYAHPSQGVMMMAKAGIVDVPVSCSPPPKGVKLAIYVLDASSKSRAPSSSSYEQETKTVTSDSMTYCFYLSCDLW
jgi:hypothetical protein